MPNSLQPHEKRILVQKLQNNLIRKYANHNFYCELVLKSAYGQPDILYMQTTNINGSKPTEEHMKLVSSELENYAIEHSSGTKILSEIDDKITIMVDYSKIS